MHMFCRLILCAFVVPGTLGWSMLRMSTKTPEQYPMSTRRALLIEKAKSIDPSVASGKGVGSYSSIGWSNRLGTVLTPAAIPGVYTGDRPFYWNGIDVGSRMVVIELSDGGLWVHSPVALDEPLKEVLAKLGRVAHVVSPNYEHVKFAKQWADAYPDACIWGCPGMREKEPQVQWTGELPSGIRPPSFTGYDIENLDKRLWDQNELSSLHMDIEVNPFTSKPFFNEVIFYHVPSKSLITTDLYWNYPAGDGVTNSKLPVATKKEDFGVWELAPQVPEVPIGSRIWKFGMDQVYRPFYMSLMVRDQKEKFLELASVICNDWEIETLIPAHGDLVRGPSLTRSILKRHFSL